ncbi:MAG TPA: sialate O-acetylesterase [Lachnospiraceae bacterium]|nr:sialate O-acetylesterase [Lachnospiraceae bacterium]
MSKNLKVASVFSNHMVLQREKNISVWGCASEGNDVTVSLNNARVSTTVINGLWNLELPPMPAGGPFLMSITDGKETITLEDVMLGEVWLAGGQSNMELELQNSKNGKEIVSAASNKQLRFYNVPRISYVDDELYKAEAQSSWQVCSSDTCRTWSAVGYYFEKELANELDVAVGVIGCNWGGTSASAWMSRDTLAQDSDLKSYVDEYEEAYGNRDFDDYCKELGEYNAWYEDWQKKVDALYKENPTILWSEVQKIAGISRWPGPMGPKAWFRAGGLYETMLQRVCPYSLRGFIYYQGESDDHKPDMYGKLLRNLILQWRKDWNDASLPFLLVQLPMFIGKEDVDKKNWPKIREHQMQTHQLLKNTGIAVILDQGEFDNIHPTDKEPVGKRLALQSLLHVYGKQVSAYGPIYKDRIINDSEIELLFDYVQNGFVIQGDTMIGFEIAGSDKTYVTAEAEVRNDRIIVSSVSVKSPRYVRYNWTNYGPVTVFGQNGIPLAPFRTDQNDEI